MGYCGPRGLPLSQFLSWDELDQAMALAWQVRQDETCSGCGVHPEVWDEDRGGHPDALRLEGRICRTCEIAASDERELAPGEKRVWRPNDDPTGGAVAPS